MGLPLLTDGVEALFVGIINARRFISTGVIILVIFAVILGFFVLIPANGLPAVKEDGDFIKYVEFNPTYNALVKAMNMDIASQKEDCKLNWIDLLAYLGAKYGGDFSKYRAKDMDNLASKLKGGKSIEEITADMKYYDYYREAYGAVLDGFLGTYTQTVVNPDNPNLSTVVEKYGLKVYSPIPRGFAMSHYDDFGNSRTYGYKRRHLGHDIMGSVGTPIIAVESGVVEALGWNQYGGWRIGIRSFDGLRYYYYAHLRKDRPYHCDLKLGDTVNAGDVIGYMGRTGYSRTENVNNIRTPHLHIGMQLIFDESQKEGPSEIWIDMYSITKLLSKKQARVIRDPETKEYYSTTQQKPARLEQPAG